MLRVVIDTVVFVRRLINPYSGCRQIVFAYFDRYRLFVSQPVVEEVLEVLQRPELTRKFRTLARLDFQRIVEILGDAEGVETAVIASTSRDPTDDKCMATAVAADADYLVSEDHDLLTLGEYSRIKIVSAPEFLSLLEADVSD